MAYNNLVERNLDLAAGTHVDREAYEKWGINLAKLQSLGRCYREGWLHNVLRRITPLTHQNRDDYLMMADLFVANAADAKLLLGQLSQSLSKFATAAGVVPSLTEAPPMLHTHLRMYFEIAALLEYKFMIAIPAPFASTVLDAQTQEEIPFIRSYLKKRFAA